MLQSPLLLKILTKSSENSLFKMPLAASHVTDLDLSDRERQKKNPLKGEKKKLLGLKVWVVEISSGVRINIRKVSRCRAD